VTAAQGNEAAGLAVTPDVKPMFPLMLDVTTVPIMVIGRAGVLSRVKTLDEYGATAVHIFTDEPAPELIAAGAARLHSRWPNQSDFTRIAPKLVFIADVDDDFAAALRGLGRGVGALVHVQDRIPLCDFHLPARVRRGHLQVTVSTDGTAAGLSRHIREYLETHIFGPEWAERVEEVAAARRKWKQEGLSFSALGQAVSDLVAARGWLKRP
jgi:precorrin-2 dehydrogenase / sirohydrochlorin ferrochelatase